MKIVPYTSVENQVFNQKETISICIKDFFGFVYKGNTSEIGFINCVFKELVIENDEEISFEKIHIGFINCYIGRIVIENIVTNNISFYFGNSMVEGLISSDKITQIQINNVLTNGLFLTNQNSVFVHYTKENISYDSWSKLIDSSYRYGIDRFFENKNAIYVDDTKEIVIGNNISRAEWDALLAKAFTQCSDNSRRYSFMNAQKKMVDLSLAIRYEKRVEQASISISNMFLASFELKGELNGNINFENSKIDNWYIHKFSVKGEAGFFNINPLNKTSDSSKLEIRQSNLDNTWFDNIDLGAYKIVSFYRTKFSKAKFSACNFPVDYTSFEKFKTLENVHYPDQKSDNYYKDQYEIFLQLKNALESNGNFYEAQKLQAISNDALMHISGIPKSDKLILRVNSKSNNHGLSIWLPFKWFVISTIGLYIIYLLSLHRIFNTNSIDYSLFGYYFSFVDPTHRIDFLEKNAEEYNFFSLTVDFFNKLICGFLIYQFIAAFRKYGKK